LKDNMIEINNLTTVSVNEETLKRIVNEVLKGEKIKQEIELSIAFIGSGRMRKLNKKYRGKNRVTDVLAFPESEILFEKFSAFVKDYGGPSEASREGGKIGPKKKIRGLGEIVICLREVKKNAKRFSTSFEKELANVLIHGLLHLLGHDHEKEKEAKEMERKQSHYLKSINYKL